MSTWTKETALSVLDALIRQIDKLYDQRRHSAEHTRWLTRAFALLEEVFGRESRYFKSLAGLEWAESGAFMVGGPGDQEGSWNPMAAIEKRHQVAYQRHLEMAKGLLQGASDHLRRTDLSSVYEGKNTAPESSAILRIINIAERKLRKLVRETPAREKEIQDAFENLLIGGDIPYSREKDMIEYSSKAYIPDFTMQKLDLAVEIKLCAKEGREKEIITEINDDILAYQTKYGNLLFIVYDVGFVRDIDRFIDSFEKSTNVIVRVVKH